MTLVAIVSYGMGNVDSVRRALEECGATVTLTGRPEELARADRILLPGVGAYPEAMEQLRERGLDDAIKTEVAAGAPLLGICLGMQVLSSKGSEGGGAEGLGCIPGTVDRLEPTEEERLIPHVGWNAVHPSPDSTLFQGIEPGTDFYFVHSYHFRCAEPTHEAATTPYVGGFTSAVSSGLVHGVQFHPEKSQQAGFAVLRNFLAL